METEVEMNFSGELRTATKYVYGNGMGGTGMNESSYSQPVSRTGDDYRPKYDDIMRWESKADMAHPSYRFNACMGVR